MKSWFINYDKKYFKFDIAAGLTASAVIIPKSIAYSVIAGLPLQIGLYTAFVPLLVYALLGSSKNLSVTTTTTIAILSATAISGAAGSSPTEAQLIGYAVTLAFLTGGFLFLAGILKLGFLANFISKPVLTGFNAGIGLLIIVSQIPKTLGIHGGHDFFEDISAIAGGLGHIHWLTFIIALAAFLLMMYLPKILRKVPAPLIVVAAAIAASYFLDFEFHNISLVGVIPAGLPGFQMPEFNSIFLLMPAAGGIALMSFAESIAAGRTFTPHGDKFPDANRELIAIGAANIAGSFFHSMPAGGGTSQTLVNFRGGAKSQFSSVVTFIVVILTLLFLAPMLGYIPNAVIAAILIEFSLGMIKLDSFRKILKVRRTEFIWSLIALAGVITLGTLEGILVAIAVSLVMLIYQANHPPMYMLGRKKGTDIYRSLKLHPDDETFEGLLILRTEGRLTFMSAPNAAAQFNELREKFNPQLIILDMSAVPDVEYTALETLINGKENLEKHGIEIWLCGLNEAVLEVFKKSGFFEKLGTDRLFFDVHTAVEKYLAEYGSRKSH